MEKKTFAGQVKLVAGFGSTSHLILEITLPFSKVCLNGSNLTSETPFSPAQKLSAGYGTSWSNKRAYQVRDSSDFRRKVAIMHFEVTISTIRRHGNRILLNFRVKNKKLRHKTIVFERDAQHVNNHE